MPAAQLASVACLDAGKLRASRPSDWRRRRHIEWINAYNRDLSTAPQPSVLVLAGARLRIAVELDGFAFHGDRAAFIYDRVRQNDLAATGLVVLRFSYDVIGLGTGPLCASAPSVDARRSARSLPAHPHSPRPIDRQTGVPPKSIESVVIVPACRPGARWYCQ